MNLSIHGPVHPPMYLWVAGVAQWIPRLPTKQKSQHRLQFGSDPFFFFFACLHARRVRSRTSSSVCMIALTILSKKKINIQTVPSEEQRAKLLLAEVCPKTRKCVGAGKIKRCSSREQIGWRRCEITTSATGVLTIYDVVKPWSMSFTRTD